MSRYIDADAMIARAFQDSERMYLESVARHTPSIDIVRCSECKYNSICNHGVQHTTRDMSSVTIGYKSVDFCSYGERKESE